MDRLTNENYFSAENNMRYCSKSQFTDFFGFDGCEAKAMAKLKGEIKEEPNQAFLLGSFVDTMLTEPQNIEKFKAEHPEMYSTRGETKGMLKSEFRRGEQMVERIKKDKKMMYFLSGESQRIMTGTLFGVDFKIKMDSYMENKFICDLKTVESMRKTYFDPSLGRITFVERYSYLLQGALYQEIVFQNTGKRLPFYLACVSKEPVTDIELIAIDNQTLHDAIYGNEFSTGIADKVERIRLLKSGEVQPTKCGICDYCLERKVIDKPIHYTELLGEI